MKKYKVVIVDDHTLFRDGLKLILNNTDEFEVVGEAANGEDFFKQLNKFDQAVILMDIEMPIMNGIEATRIAVEKNPDIKIVALTMYGDHEYYYRMIEAGAKGFLLKNSEIDDVIKAIKMVANGESYFSKDLLLTLVKNISELKIPQKEKNNLSEREIEILHLICQGYSNQEIADKLFVSKRTIDKHRSNILDKTNSKNTASLVMYAIKNNLIQV